MTSVPDVLQLDCRLAASFHPLLVIAGISLDSSAGTYTVHTVHSAKYTVLEPTQVYNHTVS